jgi:tetratricopeptide (TPR) repeat protein
MDVKSKSRWMSHPFLLLWIATAGCTQQTYREYWLDAQRALAREDYGTARILLTECERRRPRRVENLHDQGVCSMMIAIDKFEQMNAAAAMRELDRAVAYFSSAIDDTPGHQASLEGKNRALELKGQFDEALKQAEWSLKFIGPSSRQFLFLARELEERGDKDGALLRYRQAIAAEPRNADAQVAMAKFLLREGNEPGAIHYLQQAHRLNPRDPWVTEQLTSRGVLPVVPAAGAGAP